MSAGVDKPRADAAAAVTSAGCAESAVAAAQPPSPTREENDVDVAQTLKQREAHITQLILDKHETKKRVEQLEEAVSGLVDHIRSSGGAPIDTAVLQHVTNLQLHRPAASVAATFSRTSVGDGESYDFEGSVVEVNEFSSAMEGPSPGQPPRSFYSSQSAASLLPLSHHERQQSFSSLNANGHMYSSGPPPPSHGPVLPAPASVPIRAAGESHLAHSHSSEMEMRSQSNGNTSIYAPSHDLQKHPSVSKQVSNSTTSVALSLSTAARAGESRRGDGEGDGDSSNHHHKVAQISAWNEELVSLVEKLKRRMLKMDSDAKAQLVLVHSELSAISSENERLRQENAQLKERVADDVLRQRQTNRIEMAVEKARNAARVRAAGQQRLEFMEGVLMEAHDDLYHTQRWDATLSPQRDVSFVFHFVSGTSFPPTGSEEFVFTVYQQVLYTTARQYGGYLAASFRGMEVFAFQDPIIALNFAKDCHEQIASLSWPQRTESVPSFSTIAEYGRVLFRGPRMHTCVYACTPEVEVDPVTGRSLFFGSALRAGIEAALELSPVGEIIVNDVWARLFCRASRMRNDSDEPVKGDVMDVRKTLGQSWDVVGMPGTCGIICSILPVTLKGRRGVQANLLGPTPKYPRLTPSSPAVSTTGGSRAVPSTSFSPTHAAAAGVKSPNFSVASMTSALVRILKGVGVDLDGNPLPPHDGGAAGYGAVHSNKRPVLQYSSVNGPMVPGTAAGLQEAPGAFGAGGASGGADSGKSNAARMLELYSLKQEKANITALYRKVEKACAALERDAMRAEDRFEISRRKLPDPSETAFVCTVDIGDDSTWKRILLAGMSSGEYDVLRNTLRSYVNAAAKHYYGFLMNGNFTDVFTYVFREVEQALAFVSEVYIQVNRTGTKYAAATHGTGQDVFLTRAGISGGPMSTIYRNLENGVLKCTGPVIRLSGTLCDLAQNGEILAMEDIISTFYAKNDNLLDTQYNIVKQRGQFLSGYDAPAVVHSILPKPFAYRRPKLMNVEPHDRARSRGTTRSAEAALMVQKRQYPRESVESLLTQQRERMERAEEARMHSEDTYEREREGATPQVTLKNPWVLTARPNASAAHLQQLLQRLQEAREADPSGRPQRASVVGEGSSARQRRRSSRLDMEEVVVEVAENHVPEVALMYCDAVGIAALKAELEKAGHPPGLANAVCAHFNHIVQGVLTQLGGFVAKTNGRCAYLVVFDSPLRALEAGVLIQQRLLVAAWPEELKTIPSTLFVRDAATSTVLFNGPRAQIALHLSNRFQWKRMDAGAAGSSGSGGIGQGVDVSGPAVEEVTVLGRYSHGGELRVTNALLDAVGKGSLSGKLLIAQLAMEVVPTPSALSLTNQAARDNRDSAARATAAGGRNRTGSASLSTRGSIIAPTPGSAAAAAAAATRRRSVADEKAMGDGSRASSAAAAARRRNSNSLTNLSAAVNHTRPSRVSVAAPSGRGRSLSMASAAAFGRSKQKPPESIVCVAAVPQRLQARLALFSSSSSPSGERGGSLGLFSAAPAAAATNGTTGEGIADATAVRVDSDANAAQDAESHPKVSAEVEKKAGETEADGLPESSAPLASSTGNGSDVAAAAGDVGGAPSASASPAAAERDTTATTGTPPPPSSPPPITSGNQLRWAVEPSGATEALPYAAKGAWQTAADAQCVSGHREAEVIQHMAEELLKLYSGVPLASVSADSPQEASPKATKGSPADTSATAARGALATAAGKKRMSVPSPPPAATTAAASVKNPSSKRQSDGDASSPTEESGLAKEQLHYRTFMRFSKELLEYCVAAMRVGNERTKPPALPKRDGAVITTAAGTALDPNNPLDAAVGGASAAALPAIPSARHGVAGGASSALVPRPPPASAAPGTKRTTAGADKGVGKGSASAVTAATLARDPYRVALDYLDEACRIFAIQTGTSLGKLTAIPTAPTAKSKPTFPTPRRRF